MHTMCREREGGSLARVASLTTLSLSPPLQLQEVRRQLAAAQSSNNTNTDNNDADTALTARYEREIADLRTMLSEARSEKFGQGVSREGGGSSTYNPGSYFRDDFRSHHINFGGDMRFA